MVVPARELHEAEPIRDWGRLPGQVYPIPCAELAEGVDSPAVAPTILRRRACRRATGIDGGPRAATRRDDGELPPDERPVANLPLPVFSPTPCDALRGQPTSMIEPGRDREKALRGCCRNRRWAAPHRRDTGAIWNVCPGELPLVSHSQQYSAPSAVSAQV